MTSFTPLSFPAVGMGSQHGHFGEEIRMSVRRLGGFVSSAWRNAVGNSRPRKSIIRRLSNIVYQDEENEEISSSEPSPSLERSWSQPASPGPGLPRRRSSLSPVVSEVELRVMDTGSHSDE